MEIQSYVFSNTFHLDFHELIVPNNEDDLQMIREILDSSKYQNREESELTLFAKKTSERIILGTNLYVSQLNELSNEYYNVARCNGATPTIATVVFIVQDGFFLPLTKRILTRVLMEAYKEDWFAETLQSPHRLTIESDICDLKLKRFLLPKCRFKDEYELFYRFNSVLQMNKDDNDFDMLYSLKPNKSMNRLEKFGDLQVTIKRA